jgi:CysZ protein
MQSMQPERVDAALQVAPAPGALARPRVGFFRGVGTFYEGLAFVVGTPGVWPLAMVPVATAALLGAGALALGVWGGVSLADAIVGAAAARWVLRVLFAAVALGVALLTALALAQPLSGWALDRIVRRRELAMGVPSVHANVPKLDALLRGLGVNLLGLAVGVPLLGMLFLAELLFPPSAIVCIPLKIMVGGLVVAWDFFDYPFSLRGMGIGARLEWIGRNFGAFFGFGLAAGTFFLVPFVGLFVLPMGVAGATTLAVRVEAATATSRARPGGTC